MLIVIKSRPARRTAVNISVMSEKLPAENLRAAAAAPVLPIHLDHPIMTAEGLIELCSITRGSGRPKTEIAFVGVLFTAVIEPGVQIGVGNRLLCFVSNNVRHAICSALASGWTIGAGALDFAGRLAAVWIADEGPFDVLAVQRLCGVKAAELATESVFTDVR